MERLEKTLEDAFNFAYKHKTYNKKRQIKEAENVCVYGLGKYFEDAFLRQNVKERFHVNLLCDGNREKLSEVSKKPEYQELKCITVEELKDYEKLIVIIMLGDPRSAIVQLASIVGKTNCLTYNDLVLDDIMNGNCDDSWFLSQKEKMFEAFHILCSQKSKELYVNILCNRIAPQLAKESYEQMCTYPQYFPKDIFQLTDKEFVVDCGAYTGDTLQEFLNLTHGNLGEYFAFELDSENYRKLTTYAEKIENVYCYNYGVWSENKDICYGRMASSDSYSIFNSREQEKARVISLDKMLASRQITLIKMDIEGSEMEALKGCRQIIIDQHPKMAICIYHRIEDMWDIPLFLKELVPEYRIDIRHHADYWVSETVCYAR